jgi:N-acetylmuramoyl-L-alanine amidase
LQGARGVLDFREGTRECAINGVRIWLSFPALQTANGWLVSRMDVAKTIEPAMRPAIIKGLANVATVVLDAGHGGHDGGAVSRYGFEKTFSLDIARRVREKLLDGGYNVILTRDSDVFIPLHDRPEVANAQSNAIFVSIHFNASQQGDAATGIEVFCIAPRGAPSTNDNYITWGSLREEPGHELDMASFALGRAVHTALIGYLSPVDRGLKRARFAVIRTARVPAILVECGFLTNPAESKAIATDAHRDTLARAIAEGINDYKLLTTLHKVPKNLADYDRAIDTKITLREDHEAGVNNEMEHGAVTNLPPLEAPPPYADRNGLLLWPKIDTTALPAAPIPFLTGRFPFAVPQENAATLPRPLHVP